MRRLLLPFLIAFCGASVSQVAAQPTLTAATNNLQIGDHFMAHQTLVGTPEFTTAGPAGANQTWNFSALTSSAILHAEVLGRSAAPNPNSFLSANMAINVGSEYAYIENVNGVLSEHALYESAQNYTLENTDPAEKLKFPITYNTTFTDTYAGMVNLGGTTIPRNGNVTVTAEGYGTIITPSGTFQNVLKIKTEEVSNAGTMYSENTITYDWFQAGTSFPLLRMTKRVSLMGTMYSSFYLDIATTGINEDLATQINLQLFPNPASATATLQFELKTAAEANVVISDLMGRKVANYKLGKTSTALQSQIINVAKLAKGIYLVQLELEGKTAVKRLVVQ